MRRETTKNPGHSRLLLTASIVVILWGCPGTAAQLMAQAEGEEDYNSLLVGLYINGANGDDLEILKDKDAYWIPLDRLADYAHFTVNPDASITTPIGRVTINPYSLLQRGGRRYISDVQLEQWLRIRSKFVSSEYALQVSVPWNGNRANSATDSGPAAPIDAYAPEGSLSFLRLRNFSDRVVGGDSPRELRTENLVDAGGRIAGGTWLLGARQVTDQGTSLDRYFWNKDTQRSATRLGTSFNNLNPLLANIDYTGVQTAWSSDDIRRYRDFDSNLNFDSFLAEDVSYQREILRDDGPPGGVAELRIDDRPVARVRVDLEGRYEFADVKYNRGGYQQISVVLYPFSPLDPPLREIDLSRQLTRELVQDGETLLRAGAGREGNPLDDDQSTQRDETAVGFLLARHGLTDRVTLQGIMQRGEDERVTAVAGLRASLSRNWATALDIGDNEGARSAFAEVVGYDLDWDLRMQYRYEAAGYRPVSFGEQSLQDATLRAFYSVTPTLRLGLLGRDFRNRMGGRTVYLKPGAYWDVTDDLFLSAVPNLNGDYRLQATYQNEYQNRFTFLSFNDVYSLVHDYNPSFGINLQSGYEYLDERSTGRVFSQLNWQLGNSVYNYLQVGASWDGNEAGARVSWRRRWRPGIQTELAWDQGYRTLMDEFEPGNRFLFTLRVDFAAVGRRLRPADNQRLNFTRGGVSGRIVTPDGQRLPVDNVGLRVDGRSLPQQQLGGEFYLGNLSPGTYNIELDEANLPIEYSPQQRQLRIEVAPASVTSFDFLVSASFGISGQARDASGTALVAQRIVALDENGNSVASAFTDQFGYYRLDALPPGDYRLQIVSPQGAPLAEREVSIVDDHLFERDLELP